jgi:iron(III) transport system permease protein
LVVTLRRVPLFTALVGAIVGAMAILVIYPIGRLLYEVFFSTGAFSATRIGESLVDRDLPGALANTALLIGSAMVGSMLIGSAFAFLNERTDARMGWAADILPIIPLLVPPLAGAIGWVFLFAPRAGYLNVLARAVLDPSGASLNTGPIDIYSMLGVIFVTTIYTVPFVYLTVAAALRNIDPSLEEASRISGRGAASTFVLVVLPSIRNALASAAVLVLITSIALFSVPVIIGSQARVDVLSVLIFRVIYATSPPRLGEAVVLSSFMLLAVQLAVLIEYLVTRTAHHSVIGGRSQARTTNFLGTWRWPARGALLTYIAGATLLPVGGLVLVSMQGFWSPEIQWGRLSLNNYVALFATQSALRQALIDSLLLAVAVATVGMIVAALIAFFMQRSPGALGQMVNALTALPASVPHTVVAIAFLVSLGTGRVSLNGSLLLLFLAYMVMLLPQASRAASAALSQVGQDLWQSSLMCGASPMRTFRCVLLPLMFAGLLAGWVILFVHALSEVTGSVFLSGATNPVVGPVILQIWQNGGTYSTLAALTVIITLVQTLIVFAVLGFERRNNNG